MRKALTIVLYSFIMLLIGRNLISLPRFSVLSDQSDYIDTLKNEIKNDLAKEKGNYSVYFYNFKDNKSFGINESQMITAASINKLPIIATLYYLNGIGKISLDEEVTLQENDIQDYGTGSLRYQEPGSTYSLQTLAKLTLQQSDNTAAHILANRIGDDAIITTMRKFGLTQTEMENNNTSVKDMYLLLRKIYEGKITNKGRTQELLGYMQDTDIEDRLPLFLPKNAVVMHKTGDAVGTLNDVGIINVDGLLFYLGIMTTDIGNNEKATKEAIGRTAKNILSFYEKRK